MVTKMDFIMKDNIFKNDMNYQTLEKELNTIAEKNMDDPTLCTDIIHNRMYKRAILHHNKKKIVNVATSTFDCILLMEEEINNKSVINAWCSIFTLKNICLIENICVRENAQGMFGAFVNKALKYLIDKMVSSTRFVLFADPSNKSIRRVYENFSCTPVNSEEIIKMKCHDVLNEKSSIQDVKFDYLGRTTTMAYVSYSSNDDDTNEESPDLLYTTLSATQRDYSGMNRYKIGQLKRRERERNEKDAVEALQNLNKDYVDVSDAEDSVLGNLSGYGDDNIQNDDSRTSDSGNNNVSKGQLGQLRRRERERFEKSQKKNVAQNVLSVKGRKPGRPARIENRTTKDAAEPPFVEEKKKRGRPPKNKQHSQEKDNAKRRRLFRNVSSDGIRFTTLFRGLVKNN